MPPSSRRVQNVIRKVRPSTWVGLAATALFALLGSLDGFWSMITCISLVLLGTAVYSAIFRRTTWLRLPRRRGIAAVGAALALIMFVGAASASAAAHPTAPQAQPTRALASADRPTGSAHTATETTSPAEAPTTTSTVPVTPTATPMPKPTPTAVVTTRIVTATSPIPFTHVTVQAPSLAKGSSRLSVRGVNGVETTTYRVTLTNGVETSRVAISRQVTTKPVAQVTEAGTYVAPAAPAAPVAPGNGATALCKDGHYSYAAHHQGACSHHGGVAQFYK